jgi:hypothetical protein
MLSLFILSISLCKCACWSSIRLPAAAAQTEMKNSISIHDDIKTSSRKPQQQQPRKGRPILQLKGDIRVDICRIIKTVFTFAVGLRFIQQGDRADLCAGYISGPAEFWL